MSDGTEKDRSGDGTQSKQRSGNTLELSKTIDAGKVRQNFSHGRSKEVTVEVKRKRTFEKNEAGKYREVARGGRSGGGSGQSRPGRNRGTRSGKGGGQTAQNAGTLTNDEKAQRRAALTAALKAEEERKKREAEDKIRAADEARLKAQAEAEAEEQARIVAENAAKAVEEQATLGRKDRAFQPVQIVKQKINVPLKK